MKPSGCQGCPGCNWGGDFTAPEGSGSLGVLVVGEASGGTEAAEGLPFRPRGEAGSVLERAFKKLGYSREQFRITNIVRCRPLGNKLEGAPYEASAIAHCKQYLDAEIAASRPKAILALGGIAARQLTGFAGRNQGVQSIRGFALDSFYGLPTVASLHPAFLRRGYMKWLSLLMNDISTAVKAAAGKLTPSPAPKHLTLDEFLKRLERHSGPIAYDIETSWSGHHSEEDLLEAADQEPDGSIVQVQFALDGEAGIALAWSENRRIIQQILSTPQQKLGYNSWLFDDPRLALEGSPVAGEVIDLMWYWHHLQPDLPRGLQACTSIFEPTFGPWKHLAGADLADYGIKDVVILQRLWPKLQAALKQLGLYDCARRHIQELRGILAKMEARGLPMDAERQAELSAYLDGEMAKADERMQELVPQQLLRSSPKNGFVRDPEITEGLVKRPFIADMPVYLRRICSCLDWETGEITGWNKAKSKCCKECKGLGYLKEKTEDKAPVLVERWCRLEPFKPSKDQVLGYAKHRGHKIPNIAGLDADSTGKQALAEMAKKTRDPMYSAILDYRGYQKMRTSYIWPIAADGCVHPTITFSPATGQLAAINPNTMTIPAPKGESLKDTLAIKVRSVIKAKPGRILLALDFSGFHTSTFALESGDASYFRLANKIGDPHSFLTAIMTRQSTAPEMLGMKDAELRQFLKQIKGSYEQVRNGQAKPAILGWALGLGAARLYDANKFDPETGAGFKSKREAERVMQALREAFPAAAEWQKQLPAEAQKRGYLRNKHGYIRYFYDALGINPRTGETVHGEQYEAALAFPVQCDAHGLLKDAILSMEKKGYLDLYRLINIVHDELVFEPDFEMLAEASALLAAEMEKPCAVLKHPILCPQGLSVKVEPKAGFDMASYKPLEFWQPQQLPLAA